VTALGNTASKELQNFEAKATKELDLKPWNSNSELLNSMKARMSGTNESSCIWWQKDVSKSRKQVASTSTRSGQRLLNRRYCRMGTWHSAKYTHNLFNRLRANVLTSSQLSRHQLRYPYSRISSLEISFIVASPKRMNRCGREYVSQGSLPYAKAVQIRANSTASAFRRSRVLFTLVVVHKEGALPMV
jgi:hypothetical protein